MAEVHIFGQILKAVGFEESKLLCKWSLQAGSSWDVIEGESEGQTTVTYDRLQETSTFCQPIDAHLTTRSIQGWPKIHLEIFAVNALNHSWPVGFGFAHLPTQPGYHNIVVNTWKVAPSTFLDGVRDKFWSGGFVLSKSDLVFSGVERYKLLTKSSGKVIVDLSLVFRSFGKFGIEYN